MLAISAAMAPGSPHLMRAPPPQSALSGSSAVSGAALGPWGSDDAEGELTLHYGPGGSSSDVAAGSGAGATGGGNDLSRPVLGLGESHMPGNMRRNLEYERRRLEAEQAIQHADLTHGRAPTSYFSGEGFSRSMPAKDFQTQMLEPGQSRGPEPPSTGGGAGFAAVPEHAMPFGGEANAGAGRAVRRGPASAFLTTSGQGSPAASKPESPSASPRLSDFLPVAYSTLPSGPAGGASAAAAAGGGATMAGGQHNERSTGTSRASSPGVAAALAASSEMRAYWNVTTLGELLSKLSLGNYTETFASQEVDLSTFLTLTETDLRELGVSTFGARRKMIMGKSPL